MSEEAVVRNCDCCLHSTCCTWRKAAVGALNEARACKKFGCAVRHGYSEGALVGLRAALAVQCTEFRTKEEGDA